MCVTVTGHEYHCSRHRKILDGCDDFSTYAVLGSFKAATSFGRFYVHRSMITSEASALVSRLYHNNKNTTVLVDRRYNTGRRGRSRCKEQ